MRRNRLTRLTEGRLRGMVHEAVRRVLNEVSIDTAIAAHKQAQSDLDDMESSWSDYDAVDKYNKRQRQADTFLDYAQDKGADYYPYGVIGWSQDESDGVFDRSEIVLGDSIEDVPQYPFEAYALTREGRETFDQWYVDASCGYDLGYGRMKGLADRIGGTERDLWNYLTDDESLARPIS